MKTSLALVALALFASAGVSHARAQDTAGWARIEDGALCLQLDEDACRRVHWTFYLWPRILKEISLIDWNKPQPDPSPIDFARLYELNKRSMSAKLDAVTISRLQLAQTKELRQRLLKAADNLAREIAAMESGIR